MNNSEITDAVGTIHINAEASINIRTLFEVEEKSEDEVLLTRDTTGGAYVTKAN